MKPKIYKWYNLKRMLQKINKSAYKSYHINFTPNWDGKNYSFLNFSKFGRDIRLNIYEEPMFITNAENILYNMNNISKLNIDSSISIKLDDTFYTLASLNYAIGQENIYINIRRLS